MIYIRITGNPRQYWYLVAFTTFLLIEKPRPPLTATHQHFNEEERAWLDISGWIVRLSISFKGPINLVDDIEQALNA
jgi:cystathionine beta-lyase/cystathionine gamma-synthase